MVLLCLSHCKICIPRVLNQIQLVSYYFLTIRLQMSLPKLLILGCSRNCQGFISLFCFTV